MKIQIKNIVFLDKNQLNPYINKKEKKILLLSLEIVTSNKKTV